MRIDILTLFPEMFAPLTESIIGRATKNNKVEINVYDIREYTLDKHKKCDDYPFGGGAGMLMLPQPISSAIDDVDGNHEALRIYTSPKGKRFEQKHIKKLLKRDRLLILCGHYEGVDQRVLDEYIDEEVSIGDYVLTGGELPAMVITDAVCRYVDGVLNKDSLSDESFTGNLLEYPQYTRPAEFKGQKVPDVLLSGNHAKIDEWRTEQAEILTQKKRPDLWRKYKRAKDKAEQKEAERKAAKKAAERAAKKAEKTAENAQKTAKTGAEKVDRPNTDKNSDNRFAGEK